MRVDTKYDFDEDVWVLIQEDITTKHPCEQCVGEGVLQNKAGAEVKCPRCIGSGRGETSCERHWVPVPGNVHTVQVDQLWGLEDTETVRQRIMYGVALSFERYTLADELNTYGSYSKAHAAATEKNANTGGDQ